jgi:hypothetical protein
VLSKMSIINEDCVARCPPIQPLAAPSFWNTSCRHGSPEWMASLAASEVR